MPLSSRSLGRGHGVQHSAHMPLHLRSGPVKRWRWKKHAKIFEQRPAQNDNWVWPSNTFVWQYGCRPHSCHSGPRFEGLQDRSGGVETHFHGHAKGKPSPTQKPRRSYNNNDSNSLWGRRMSRPPSPFCCCARIVRASNAARKKKSALAATRPTKPTKKPQNKK